MKNVRTAIYARFSSDKQSDASIEDQVHRARSFITTQGGDCDTPQVFTDFAVSGASMDRPGMRALEEAIKRGAFDILITESVDRISRDVEDAARFRKLLTQHDVGLECLDGTRLTASGKSDALMFGMRSLFAEQYRHDLADKTRRGLEGRARKGAPTGAVAFGFRIVTADKGESKTVEIDPTQAQVVRRIFALYIAGDSLATIAAKLNADGVPAPRAHSRRSGNGWMHSAVRSMLLNERYRGVWTFGQREWVKVLGSNIRRPKARKGGPLVTRLCPDLALVDQGTWSAVAARFARNPVMPAKKRTFLLSGLLHCEVCGGRMQFTGGGTSSKTYFGCSNALKRRTCSNRRNVPTVVVEQAVLDAIRSHLAGCVEAVHARLVERLKTWSSARPDQRVHLSRELSDVTRKLGNLVDLAASAGGSSTVAAKIRDLEGRRKQLHVELAEVNTPVLAVPTPEELLPRILSIARLASAPPDQARERLRGYLADGRVYCGPIEGKLFKLSGGLLPVTLFAPESRKPLPEDSRERLLDHGGCGGWI